MKRIFSIFLSVIFLTSAMGLSINSHYCEKKLNSVSLVARGCCCNTKTPMKKGCCGNETKYIKIADDYSPSAQFHFEKINIAPIVFNFHFSLAVSDNLVSILLNNHYPPPKFSDRVIAFRSILV